MTNTTSGDGAFNAVMRFSKSSRSALSNGVAVLAAIGVTPFRSPPGNVLPKATASIPAAIAWLQQHAHRVFDQRCGGQFFRKVHDRGQLERHQVERRETAFEHRNRRAFGNDARRRRGTRHRDFVRADAQQ